MKSPKAVGSAGRDDPLDQLLGAAPVGDQVGDGDHLQAVLLAVGDQVGDAGHRAVVVHHLADHPGRGEAGEAGEVDAGLGVAGALEHAALFGPQREHVAGDDDVARARLGVDRDLDRVGAVVGGDAGADPAGGLDRDREGGLQRRLVLGRHQVQAEPFAALGGQRQADQPARLLGHEVDRLGGGELRRHHQVALVLAVLAVADDDHAAAADLLDRLLDRRERALPRLGRRCLVLGLGHLAHARSFPANGATNRSTYFATMSHSTFSLLPGASSPRFVRSRVSGISETSTQSSPSSAIGEADPAERDRALVDRVAQQLGGEGDADAAGEAVLLDRDDLADAVDVALDDVAAEPVGGLHRQLQVDRGARPRRRRARSPRASGSSPRSRSRSRRPRSRSGRRRSTATESPRRDLGRQRGRDAQAGAVAAALERLDRADVLDQAGEHLTTP